METQFNNPNSPLFCLDDEISEMKSMKRRNPLMEIMGTMTDSDLMNMLLDKKSENIPEDDVGRVFSALGIDDPLKRMKEKLIFKLEFELRRRREEKYGTDSGRKTKAQMDAELEEKKRSVSITDVISSMTRMDINSTNRNYRCPLPDHKKDNTPSFHIYEHTGTWKCFGCQKGGTAIDFIMHHEQVDVKKAIELFLKNF